MKFEELHMGTLIKRYKRFLADVELDDGTTITSHTTNTGSMMGCCEPGSKVGLTFNDSPKRKLKYTWEIVKVGTTWVGVNTHIPNYVASEAILDGTIKELDGYKELRREVKYGKNSRIDILLNDNGALCYVEVKNTTLAENGVAMFPDAVTTRGQKHLQELMDMVKEGHRAAILFFINRSDCKEFRPATHIDPKYTELLKEAEKAGVHILPYMADVSPEGITLTKKLPYILE